MNDLFCKTIHLHLLSLLLRIKISLLIGISILQIQGYHSGFIETIANVGKFRKKHFHFNVKVLVFGCFVLLKIGRYGPFMEMLTKISMMSSFVCH